MSQLFKIMLFSFSFAAESLCDIRTEGLAPAQAAQNQQHQQTHQKTHRDFAHTHTNSGGHAPFPPSIENNSLQRKAWEFQKQIDEYEDVSASKKKHTNKKLVGVATATAVAGVILAQQGALDGLPIVGKDGEAGGEGGEAADAG